MASGGNSEYSIDRILTDQLQGNAALNSAEAAAVANMANYQNSLMHLMHQQQWPVSHLLPTL